jgi:hypothetical protein
VKVYELAVVPDNAILLYGPENPGDFVTLNLALMESDADIRMAGENLDAFISDAANKTQASTLLAANPTVSVAIKVAEEMLALIARKMMKNDDDKVMLIHDSWLRDSPIPYDINHHKIHANDFAEMTLRVMPMISSK